MTDGQFPSSDIYVRSIVEEQVRSLREIIRGVSQKAPLSEDALFLDHLLQMVSLAAADGLALAHEREPVGRATGPPRCGPGGGPRAARHGPAGHRAGAGDHREHRGARVAARGRRAGAVACAGRGHRHRRLRRGLFVLLLPARAAGGPLQAGPQLPELGAAKPGRQPPGGGADCQVRFAGTAYCKQ